MAVVEPLSALTAWLRQAASSAFQARAVRVGLVGAALLVLALLGRSWLRVDHFLRLAQDQNIVARQEALAALGRLRSARALPLLEKIAADPAADRQTREIAIAALGNIGAPGALDTLVGLLDDPAPRIVEAAVVALGCLGDGRAVGPLVRLAREKRARLAALWSLGAIGDDRAVPLLNLELSDPDVYVAYNAKQSLKRIVGR